MARQVRIEIIGRNEYWKNAVFVEWEYQYPDRKLETDGARFHLIQDSWLDDLHKVAEQCFSKILIAPKDPGRRGLFSKLLQND